MKVDNVTVSLDIGDIHWQETRKGAAPLKWFMDWFECAIIRTTLARGGGNMAAVAKDLGISRQALYTKMEKHGLRNVRDRMRKDNS